MPKRKLQMMLKLQTYLCNLEAIAFMPGLLSQVIPGIPELLETCILLLFWACEKDEPVSSSLR
jgi:hypothetical protein